MFFDIFHILFVWHHTDTFSVIIDYWSIWLQKPCYSDPEEAASCWIKQLLFPSEVTVKLHDRSETFRAVNLLNVPQSPVKGGYENKQRSVNPDYKGETHFLSCGKFFFSQIVFGSFLLIVMKVEQVFDHQFLIKKKWLRWRKLITLNWFWWILAGTFVCCDDLKAQHWPSSPCLVSPEAQRGHHDQREDRPAVRDGLGAGEEVVGGPLPVLHGGEGDAGPKPAGCGEETSGPVQTVPGCPGDRRLGHGETSHSAAPHEFKTL